MRMPDMKMTPWCTFCGQKIGRPKSPERHKLGEFSVGRCLCGAVYTCDPTGHNIGAAMVDALVYACDDNWDLAWDLLPEEDYLTGQIENYDEQTHQVNDAKKVDGRRISGVLYFVRLHKDISELTGQLKEDRQKRETSIPGPSMPALEPERDPKRPKKKADKTAVRKLVAAGDIDGLVDLVFDDVKTLHFFHRLLYSPDEAFRWQTIHILGKVCARFSTRKPGAVSDLLHRFFASCSDSASTNWGAIEAIGSIIANRPDIYGAFTRHLLKYFSDPSTQMQVIWAFGTIARDRPDLIRNTPFYCLFPFIKHTEPLTRGHVLRLLGRIRAHEVKKDIEELLADQAAVTIYEEGLPQQTTVSALAKEALALINEEEVKQP